MASAPLSKTSDEWDSLNPVLAAGVFGYDSTKNLLKLGDGTKSWSQLKYVKARVSNALLFDLESSSSGGTTPVVDGVIDGGAP